jgi:geranylgeranyl diphosphate synthase type I
VAPISPPPRSFLDLRDRLEVAMRGALDRYRADLAAIDGAATTPLDEISRLLDAGGKRLRPIVCYWGYRAGGGADGDEILLAAGAFELLHAMALIHDDVMDATPVRRGVAASHVHLADRARERGLADPDRVGVATAILAGDLAAVLADRLLLDAGFPPGRLEAALAVYHRIRTEMAAGQFLDLTAADRDARRVAHLKGGTYTVTGPLLVGASLAGAEGDVIAVLERVGDPLGQAFQLLDDLQDQDAAPGVSAQDVAALAREADAAIEDDVLAPEAATALHDLIAWVAA